MHKACLASPLSWLTLPPAITGSATYTSSPRNKYCTARVPRNGRLMAPPDKRPPPLSQGVSRPGLSPASHTLLLQLFSISHFGQVHCSSAKAPDHCFCLYQLLPQIPREHKLQWGTQDNTVKFPPVKPYKHIQQDTWIFQNRCLTASTC